MQQDEPAEKCNGLINRSSSTQYNYGLAGQWSWSRLLAGRRNQFTAGAAFDASRTRFMRSTQLGFLNADRSVTGVNAFGDGVSGGDVDGAPYNARVDLNGQTRTWSLFATDTLSLTSHLHLTLSARYNRTLVQNADQIHPDGGLDSLNGEHRFSRINPAIGLTYSPTAHYTAYAGFNEGSRAPSTIELGCANPDRPCKLPNSMAGDPPLNQVVTRTWEAGLRGAWSPNLKWNAGLFRATNHADILFVADDQAGYGYFKNFGKTRRQGIELGVDGKIGSVSLGANYTWLDATFQSPETVNGSSNSSNSQAVAGSPGMGGMIEIRPGDGIPLTPRHMLKLQAAYRLTPQFSVNVNVIGIAGSYARGNENNAHQADGTYYLGPGKTAGYTIVNVGGDYVASPSLQFFVQVNNLFDKRYTTAAQLGPAGFDGNGNFVARPLPAVNGAFPLQHATFYAPGAPRLIWLGLKYWFNQAGRR